MTSILRSKPYTEAMRQHVLLRMLYAIAMTLEWPLYVQKIGLAGERSEDGTLVISEHGFHFSGEWGALDAVTFSRRISFYVAFRAFGFSGMPEIEARINVPASGALDAAAARTFEGQLVDAVRRITSADLLLRALLDGMGAPEAKRLALEGFQAFQVAANEVTSKVTTG